MPRIQVLTEVRGRTHEVMLTEHVPAEMFANEHYADQLVERGLRVTSPRYESPTM
jgi:hypothetical protein